MINSLPPPPLERQLAVRGHMTHRIITDVIDVIQGPMTMATLPSPVSPESCVPHSEEAYVRAAFN